MSNPNQHKGRTLLLQWFDGSNHIDIGGIKTKEFTRENPVADTTSQATAGNETESAYMGYSTVTLTGSGVVDKRETASLASYKQLSAIANSSDPCDSFRLTDGTETYTGEFNITSFSKTAEQTDLIQFSISLQNAGTITFSQA